MNYFQIIYLIFSIIFQVLALFMILFVIFFIIGLFFKKKFPESKEKSKIGIVVSARNEENVIVNLIKSVKEANYPQDLVSVFIVAHNCTDKTAKLARENGAIVYEYNNLEEKRKGFALRYLFNQIDKDYGISSFDGFLVLDSDNTISEDYLSKMNDAFIARNKENVISSYRNSSNFSDNCISAQYGLFFIFNNIFMYRGRTACNVHGRVTGTGYLVPSSILKDGWNYTTLTEDWELNANEIMNNHKIIYCDEAEFFDEQPTSLKVMYMQRLRWAKGLFIIFKKQAFTLFKSIFKKSTKYKISLFDTFTNIVPYILTVFLLNVLEVILLASGLIFDHTKTFYDVFLNTGEYSLLAKFISGNNPNLDLTTLPMRFLFSSGYLFALLRSFIIFYVLMVLASILIYILEHKRIKNVPFMIKLESILLFPLFSMMQFIIDFNAMVVPNVRWSAIPHVGKKRKK